MDVSIVICSWNNSDRLRMTLDALCQCVIPASLEWQVVLVNNACTDRTDSVAETFSTRLPLIYTHEPVQGHCRARNRGLDLCAGKLAILTDDDVIPCHDWIAEYWRAYELKGEGFYFGGPIESQFEGATPSEDLLRVAPYSVKGLYWGREARLLAPSEEFIGPNWACSLAQIRAAGGFDISTGLNAIKGIQVAGDETDLMRRLRERGLAPWYVPGARIRHFVPARKCTLKHIAAREYGYGFSLGTAQRETRRDDRLIRGIPRWMFREGAQLWLNWLMARARGKKAYSEYLDWQRFSGKMRGVRYQNGETNRSHAG